MFTFKPVTVTNVAVPVAVAASVPEAGGAGVSATGPGVAFEGTVNVTVAITPGETTDTVWPYNKQCVPSVEHASTLLDAVPAAPTTSLIVYPVGSVNFHSSPAATVPVVDSVKFSEAPGRTFTGPVRIKVVCALNVAQRRRKKTESFIPMILLQ